MSSIIHPAAGYTAVTRHGYLRGFPKAKKAQTVSGFERFSSLQRTPGSSAAIQRAVSLLSEKTSSLAAALAMFSFPAGASALQYRSATVSDSEKASARAAAGAEEKTYTLDIDAVASKKTVNSSVLVRDAAAAVSDGSHAFVLTVDGEEHTLKIDVNKSGDSPDTNRDVLRKVARAVESASSALEASVHESERSAYSAIDEDLTETLAYLTIQAAEAGEENDFSLEDAAGGSLLADLGLDHVTVSGKNSSYLLNKNRAASDSNTITADSGLLEFTLLEKTGDPIEITVAGGADELAKDITGLIAGYNAYISWLDENSDRISSELKNALSRDVQAISRDLSAAGLKVTANGMVGVSKQFGEILEAETGSVRAALTGDTGLFTIVASHLETVQELGASSYAVSSDEQTQGFVIDVYA